MRTRRHQAGVTLLELLIAVTLLSLLSAGMLFAIRAGFDAMSRTGSRFAENRRVLGAQRVLYQQIAGLIPVPAKCPQMKGIFFQGVPQGMRFVTSYSLEQAARGYPQVVEYSVRPGENGQGVRLLAAEIPYAGPQIVTMLCMSGGGSPFGEPRWFVIADKLAYCRLSYLIKDPRSPNPAGVWSPVFAGDRPPIAIRFDMAPIEADAARLQMSAMTVPVRLTRAIGELYKDIDDEPVRPQ
jgi:prepilin-type N-terminal cleavage/methylation domain-containing protein